MSTLGHDDAVLAAIGACCLYACCLYACCLYACCLYACCLYACCLYPPAVSASAVSAAAVSATAGPASAEWLTPLSSLGGSWRVIEREVQNPNTGLAERHLVFFPGYLVVLPPVPCELIRWGHGVADHAHRNVLAR